MRGIMVIFVGFAFAVPSVISTPCNQTGSHAALRGQPEQCENVHMPSTSLSFNTSVARSEFFLTSRHYQKLLGLVYKRTAFWKFLAIESTISSMPLRPTGRSGRSQGGANQVRIICGLRPAASANKILATLEPEPQSNEILVLKTTPKPIAECLAANFQADVLDQLDCTGASRQARDEHFAHPAPAAMQGQLQHPQWGSNAPERQRLCTYVWWSMLRGDDILLVRGNYNEPIISV